MNAQIRIAVLSLLIGLSSSLSYAGAGSDSVTLYGGIDLTTFESRPNDKPRPTFEEHSWGEKLSPLLITLQDIVLPPDTPDHAGPSTPPNNTKQKIGEFTFAYTTHTGGIYKASVRVRQTGDHYGSTFTCTNPDGESAQGSTVSRGDLKNLSFIEVACPRLRIDEKHYIAAVFFLTVDPKTQFGEVR